MKRSVFTMIGVVMVITVSGLGALTSYATSSGGAINNQETLAKPAVYTANVIQNMGNWENINDTWKFKLKDGSFLTYSWVQSINNESYYYFLSSDGVMLTNTTTPDGYVVDSAGIWTSNKENQSTSSNKTISNEEVSEIMESRTESDVQPQESQSIGTLKDYYESEAESHLADENFMKELQEKVN